MHLHLYYYFLFFSKQHSLPPLITLKRHKLTSWVVVIETPEWAAEYSQSDGVSDLVYYECVYSALELVSMFKPAIDILFINMFVI